MLKFVLSLSLLFVSMSVITGCGGDAADTAPVTGEESDDAEVDDAGEEEAQAEANKEE